MTWSPILAEPGSRAGALAAVRDIIEELRALPASPLDGLKGDAGQAVLLAYAEAVGLGDDLADAAALKLDGALAALGRGTATAALWTGFAGVGWALAHLADRDASADAHDVIDTVIERRLDADDWTDPYDLIGGLVGLGVSVLERLAEPRARRIAEAVLRRLESRALPRAEGLAWHTDARHLAPTRRERYPGGEIEINIAHGMAGVVALCASWIAAGFEPARSRCLLDGAVRWIRRVAEQHDLTTHEGWCDLRGDATMALSWCNGAPGLAAALFAAARVTRDARGEALALDLMRTIAGRPLADGDVPDAAFCHGGAGVAHILNRLHQATAEPVLGDAARCWIDRVLAMRRPGAGVAGFPAWKATHGGGSWVSDPTLISGAAGVGLVLLAAASAVEPAWDAVFLVGAPAPCIT